MAPRPQQPQPRPPQHRAADEAVAASPAALDPRATRYYKHVKNGGAEEARETDFRGRGASRR
eukprot:211883-Prymnesium_polylepis.1